jgi:hypothetical protein
MKPGQELRLRDAIDLICDVWNLADKALREDQSPPAGETAPAECPA